MKYLAVIIVSMMLTSCVSTPVLDLSGHGKGASDYWKTAYRAPPVYPRRALKKGIIGCVHLRNVISSSGKSMNVEVVHSVPSDIFDYSAKQALRKYRWVATNKNKERKPVKSDWILTFTTTENPQAPSCVQPETIQESKLPPTARTSRKRAARLLGVMFTKTPMCECKRIEEFYEPHPDEELQEIYQSFSEIDFYEHYRLAKCRECGQYWITEPTSRGPLIVKAEPGTDLSTFDEIKYRKLSYLKLNGGNSQRQCAWADCENKAVNEMAICVDHVFNT